MTPDQQRTLLATYGDRWTTADVLLSDDGITAAKASMQGGTHPPDGKPGFYETTARGIVTFDLHVDGDQLRRVNVELAVPWKAVSAHRRALPPALLDQLRAARQAFQEHQPYPTPYPDLGVRKVGPNQEIHPDDRDLYDQRWVTYQRDVVEPWHAERRVLEDALAAAVRACLPLADDTGPVDLLDHLAALDEAGGAA